MESQESQTQEDWQNDISEQSLTLEEYQLIQNRLYAIGSQANKSIVTITSVVSDTDWFNNSYELEGQGTGTIIGERGGNLLILTEKKVIKDASKISVTFINNTVAPAELMKYDGNTGLAVLSVDKSELEEKTLSAISVMEIASATNSVRKGSIVIALGSPLGTNYSILTGNITATNNEISTQDNNYYVFTTDIVANKNSSGILIDTDGELVGIVMQSYGADLASTLTAIDVSEIQMLLELLFADKDVPYLGVLGSTVTDAIADEYGIPKGVYIKEVTMDSPAMNAGLQSGDVILSLAGEDVHTVREYNTVLMGLSVEETYTAVIKREGTNGYQTINCKIKIGVLK
jgi:serine protease Do